MHEVAAHPQAVKLLELFVGHAGGGEFEPLATTGVLLATREDWREVLTASGRAPVIPLGHSAGSFRHVLHHTTRLHQLDGPPDLTSEEGTPCGTA
jgi:hypothetical protein